MDAKDPSQPAQHSNGRISLAPLNTPKMAHRNAGIVGQGLLAHATSTAQALDIRPDDPLPVHLGRC